MIYLDHAATTPVKKAVLTEMLPYFIDQFANPSASYTSGRQARQAIDRARAQVASLIGAQAQEVAFTSGGSEADNWAIHGSMDITIPEKNHIVTTQIEHHAVLHACEAMEKRGFHVTYVGVDDAGRVDPQAIERAMKPETALVSVMLANNEVGTVEPVAEIAKVAHAHHALMHTDAVQAVGHIPVDVNTLGVDLLSLAGHKFYGPKGVGALYIRRGVRLSPLIYGGAQERGMRAGTENTAAIVGLGRAAALAGEEMEARRLYVQRLRNQMEERLLACLPGVRINARSADRLPGHLHVTIENADTELLLMQLDMAGIAASAGSACASGAQEQSHVLRAMGIQGERQANIRFTLGESNTQDEIVTVVDMLEHILGPSANAFHHTC